MTLKKCLAVGLVLVAVGCEEFLVNPPEENEILDGPIEGLTPTQLAIFLAGDIAFNDDIFSPETGLGPIFVSTSCGGCHAGDGKGHPSTILTRFGRMEGNQFDHLLELGGPQLQNRAIKGYVAEEIPAEATGITDMVAPAITGLGLLAAVLDQTFLDLVEIQKAEGIVSGELQYITPPDFFRPQLFHMPNPNGQYIGRFGKKAGAIDLLMQTVGAYKEDMGVTSDFDPVDPINFAVSNNNTDPVEDPEVSAATVQNVVFYIQTLKPPIPRNQDDPIIQSGKQLFEDIGCANCHLSTLRSGFSNIEPLSNKTFHPYTDLLMHNMGPQLDDGWVQSSELSSEWRTPPLWGLGLSPDSQGGSVHLLHDGRAKSIEEAILLHGGESAPSKESFEQLNRGEKDSVLTFLNSL
jgi:CxxC motif-containing protein (DUF1111 family)